MIHEMKIREIYFDKIKSGEKIYEIRLNDEKRKLIQIGDNILFRKNENLNKTLAVKVEDLLYFNSFKEMALTLSLKEIGFENSTIEQVDKIYHSFYTPENEKLFGVVAIKVKTI